MSDKKQNKLLYDFSVITGSQKIAEVYPELGYYKEFDKPIPGLSLIKICIYVSNLIDRGSDISNIKDYTQRAELALQVAGFEKKGKWPEKLLKVIEGKNQYVNAIITKYFELYASYDYEAWLTKKISFHQISAEMRKPLDKNSDDILRDIEKKNKISAQLDTMKTDLMKLEERLFDDKRIRDMIISETSKNQRHYAEEYAQENTVI